MKQAYGAIAVENSAYSPVSMQELGIFAAAGLKNALEDVGALFVEDGQGVAPFSYAPSMRRAFMVFQ